MTVTVAQVREALATASDSITGVTKAFARVPRAIQPAELPCAIILPARATYDEDIGHEEFTTSRVYQIALYVALEGDHREYMAESAVETFIELFQTYFQARPAIKPAGSGEAFNVTLDGDSGPAALPFPPGANRETGGQIYGGVVFDLTIVTIRTIGRLGF
jgi:hypothetical protein